MPSSGSLFKRRDHELVTAQLLAAPVYWVFAPERTLWSLLVIAALSEVFLVSIYAFNRLTELPTGDAAARRHKLLLIGSLVAFVPLWSLLPNTTAQASAFAILGIGMSYSVKFPIAGATRQLKQLYAVKPTMVALGYALQWLAFTGSTSGVVLSLFAWQFFDVLILTTLLDILDVKEDTTAGVRTFPVVHGFKGTLRLLLGINLVCLVSGAAVLTVASSWALVLLVFPRTLERQWRLSRLSKGKRAGSLNATALRLAGTVGALLHWARLP
jgi:4-hydroxybenzoate polyprenyltransferase